MFHRQIGWQATCWAVLLALCLGACGHPTDPPPPSTKATTYRVLGGISMGGVGAAALGFSRPERFDGVGVLGGPVDAAFMLHAMDDMYLGGFCPLETLEALAKADPVSLNDPAVGDACSRRAPTMAHEHSQDFNHWVATTNGAAFFRTANVHLFTDLSLAFGNVFFENPASPFAPPGVDVERVRRPPDDFCRNPLRVKGLFNAEHNPAGQYDAITFCDGQPRLFYCRTTRRPVDFCADRANIANPLRADQEDAYAAAFCQAEGGAVEATRDQDPLYMLDHAGQTDPCRLATEPMPLTLAVDLNGNGRRDYAEPVIDNGRERLHDVGVDGCADAFEDGHGGCLGAPSSAAGDPNGDDYEPLGNPLGTEGDWRWEEGEPFADDGLDGVPGTGDFGEGNGVYDLASGRRAYYAFDARSNFRALDPAARRRVDVLLDGGLRDPFNFGLQSELLLGTVRALRDTPVALYRDFLEIPGMVNRVTGRFSPWNSAWKRLPRDLLVLYGKEQPTDTDRVDGEGDHVGTGSQAVHRLEVMFNWAAATWPSLERPSTPFGGGEQRVEWYPSAVLGAKREFAVALPPGYDDPANAQARYPVLYLLHGYGMEPGGFASTAVLAQAFMSDPQVALRPMIIVYPSGRCCFVNRVTGARDCREHDDEGASLSQDPALERECWSGTFFVNRRGYAAGDGLAYGDALFELMDYIDGQYRTLGSAEVLER